MVTRIPKGQDFDSRRRTHGLGAPQHEPEELDVDKNHDFLVELNVNARIHHDVCLATDPSAGQLAVSFVRRSPPPPSSMLCAPRSGGVSRTMPPRQTTLSSLARSCGARSPRHSRAIAGDQRARRALVLVLVLVLAVAVAVGGVEW